MNSKSSIMICLMAIAAMMSCTNAVGDTSGQPQPAAGTAAATTATTPSGASASAGTTSAVVPLGAQALIAAYPQKIKGYADNQIIFTDGSKMQYDDGRKKDFDTMLDNSDIEDMFWCAYVDNGNAPEYLADAGRSRCDALFKKMYGSSAQAVQHTLVPVKWFGQTVNFTAVNGAADSLRAVAAELAKYPDLKKYFQSSGAFYWRQVRGANRMSAHSYGIAFDIAVPYSDYWLWDNRNAKETSRISYKNRIPRQIVDAFRKHGFVWGGAWYHYDTMHFEFRPEILRYAQLSAH